MILRTNDPNEKKFRTILANILGDEDEADLTRWVWENEKGSGVGFVRALAAMAEQSQFRGPQFAKNCLEFARKPKEVREAEKELLEWFNVHAARAITVVKEHNGDRHVADDQFNMLCYGLQEKLREMWPNKHRATVKGAMLSAFTHASGTFQFEVARLVKVMMEKDPLEVTARTSWAVSD